MDAEEGREANSPRAERPGVSPEVQGRPRLRLAQRDQVEIRCCSLDQLIAAEHPVRVVWEAVCGLDLSGWLRGIRAVEGCENRDRVAPGGFPPGAPTDPNVRD